ncbi:MAG: CoA ester lyase [Dehalococcoidia bacterium]|nr:CoA ester lyase [Dehalococcoidia bacterium]
MGLLRTLLFIPGNKAKMLEKAWGLGADAVILDLEDAVPLADKGVARHLVAGTLSKMAAEASPAIFVRVNSLSSGLLEADLREVVQPGLGGICFPKAESAADIRKLVSLLDGVEQAGGLPQDSLTLIPLIESARGVIAAYEIASASSRVVAIALGAEDLTLDLGVERTAAGVELLHARSVLVMAAVAAGIAPIDAVYPDLSDEDGLLREAHLGRQLGFQGKLLVHPKQIGPVNGAFRPSQDEVERARRIVQAFQEAERSGSGVVLLDGKMVDRPVVLRAKRTLEGMPDN